MSRYQAYPAYKESGVEFLDSLPAGWRTLRGKYVFSEYSERSESGEEQLLSVSEYYGVKPRGEVIEEGDFLSRAESLVGYKKCQKNDLVMNIMLAWKCGLGVSKFDGIVSPAYSVFRFNGNASPDYMHYLLRTDTYTGHFKTRSTGVIDSRLRLYPESFCDVSLVLPSINEQEKIVTFLDHETAKIDALIEKQQRLIELLKEKRQAVISHAVTKGLNPNAPMKDSGVEWLGEVPAHWEVLLIKYLSDSIGTGGTPKSELSFTEESEISWFTPGDFSNHAKLICSTKHITNRAVANGDAKVFRASSILVIGIGATLGKVALCESNFSCNQQINVVSPNSKAKAEFLVNSLQAQTEQMKNSSNFSTIGIMNQEKTKQLVVAVPPLDEQVAVATFLDEKKMKFDAIESQAVNQIALLQERRTALISAAVTGKIDVRDWQAAD